MKKHEIFFTHITTGQRLSVQDIQDDVNVCMEKVPDWQYRFMFTTATVQSLIRLVMEKQAEIDMYERK